MDLPQRGEGERKLLAVRVKREGLFVPFLRWEEEEVSLERKKDFISFVFGLADEKEREERGSRRDYAPFPLPLPLPFPTACLLLFPFARERFLYHRDMKKGLLLCIVDLSHGKYR